MIALYIHIEGYYSAMYIHKLTYVYREKKGIVMRGREVGKKEEGIG